MGSSPYIPSKLPQVGTTIFTVMSKLAHECGAINLSQGFPDYNGPQALLDRVTFHMTAGHNQYAPMAGLPQLRQKLAEKCGRLYGYSPSAEEEITITSGGTEALYAAIAATIREGDEVIIPEPAYDSYIPAVRLHGGVPITVPMTHPLYSIDWEGVRKRMNQRTRMIIINTPHNPTGSTLSADDMQQLIRLVKDTDILVLSDEVYEHMVFDDAPHQSVLRYPDLYHRSFVVFSFGKTYHVTGWKTGYCIAPPALMREFRKVHQYVVFAAPTPFQYALADYLDHTDAYLTLPAFYQHKRDFFAELMADTPFRLLPCRGTYFQLADYSAISTLPDTDFATWLTREHGVAVIPLSPFYQNGKDHHVVRFCFAKEEATLTAAANRLRHIS